MTGISANAQIDYALNTNGIRLYPQTHQLYPRSSSNQAIVSVQGDVSVNYPATEKIELLVSKKLLDGSIQDSIYSQISTGSFSFFPVIEAGMYLYSFHLNLIENGVISYRDTIATDVVCGDVYIITGQSNAMGVFVGDGSLGVLQDQDYQQYPSYGSNQIYSKCLGMMPPYNGTNGSVTNYYPNQNNWGPANANPNLVGLVGAWGLKLQYLIQQEHQMPTCILNGAFGNTWLLKHQLNYSPTNDPSDLSTLFGCMTYRINQGELKNHIKGVIWFQGEAQRSPLRATTYADSLNMLIGDWETHWGEIGKAYIIQVHTGCGLLGYNKVVREQQRTIQRPEGIHQNVVSLTSNGIGDRSDPNSDPYHICHFSRPAYNNLADRIFQLVSRDFYGGTNTVTSPNIQRAYYENNQLILEFDQILDNSPQGIESSFLFYRDSELVPITEFGATNFYTNSNKLYMAINSHIPTSVSYLGENDPVYNNEMIWLKNLTGYGAFSFHQFPIQAQECPNSYLQLFPNPLSDDSLLQLEIKSCATDNVLKIYNLLGQVIYTKSIPFLFSSQALDLKDYEKGTYIFIIENGEGIISRKKFVKQ